MYIGLLDVSERMLGGFIHAVSSESFVRVEAFALNDCCTRNFCSFLGGDDRGLHRPNLAAR
jgi:hypothetical protein